MHEIDIHQTEMQALAEADARSEASGETIALIYRGSATAIANSAELMRCAALGLPLPEDEFGGAFIADTSTQGRVREARETIERHMRILIEGADRMGITLT